MAIGRKTGGRDFPKGQASNPDGRPAMPDSIKKLQKNSRVIIMTAMCDIILMPVAQVEALADDREAAAMPALLASVMKKAITFGCHQRAQFFMNYMVGKPLEYDASELEEEGVDLKETLNEMPSSVLTKALQDYKDAIKSTVT